jgi:hypothetical protein
MYTKVNKTYKKRRLLSVTVEKKEWKKMRSCDAISLSL